MTCKCKRRVLGGAFKAKVALAAIRGDRTLSRLSSHLGVNANQISAWKKKLLSDAGELFEEGRKRRHRDEVTDDELFEQIGRLKMELEWLKKSFHVRLIRGVFWWSQAMTHSASDAGASYWD